jgi:hypothetical protein
MNTDSTIRIYRPLGVAIRHHLTAARYCGLTGDRRRFAIHARQLAELEKQLPDECRLDGVGKDDDTINVLRPYVDERDGSVRTEIAAVLHLNGLDQHAEPAQRGLLYSQLAERITTSLHQQQAELIG